MAVITLLHGSGPLLLRYSPIAAFLWLIGVIIYRRYFHPLANVPGPFLASITDYYIFYYHLLARRSQLYLHTEELHKRYGPVVRIRPNEIHLNEPAIYDKINSMGTKYYKYGGFYQAFQTGSSAFGTATNELHKIRRTVLGPFFSRQKVLELENHVQSKAWTLSERLTEELAAGRPVSMHHAYRCVAMDVTTHFAFGHCWDLLKTKDFGLQYFNSFEALSPTPWFFMTFPSARAFADLLPFWLVKRFSYAFACLVELQEKVRTEIKAIAQEVREEKDKHSEKRTIFHYLLDPDAGEGHVVPSEDQMMGEGFLLICASTDTSGNAMTTATYHVLANDRIRRTLLAELEEAFPDPNARLDFLTLEKLPYLTAVIKEGLRLSYGVPGRLPRVVPKGGDTLSGYKVPAGTIVSMGAWDLHRNTDAFPDPATFAPERWLDPTSARNAERCMIPFGKGPRQCLGMPLAYCELYVTLGTIFHRFPQLEVFQTGPEDFDFDEYFIPVFLKRKFHVTARN